MTATSAESNNRWTMWRTELKLLETLCFKTTIPSHCRRHLVGSQVSPNHVKADKTGLTHDRYTSLPSSMIYYNRLQFMDFFQKSNKFKTYHCKLSAECENDLFLNLNMKINASSIQYWGMLTCSWLLTPWLARRSDKDKDTGVSERATVHSCETEWV